MKVIDDIQHVLVVGAGTLGLRIALRCALDGYKVTMYDISEEQLTTALKMQTHLTESYFKKGMFDNDAVVNAKANLQVSTDLAQACKSVDLISESIIEDIDIKKEFYQRLMKHVAKDVIITTNTSYLLPSDLLDCISQPDYFCALHFHDEFGLYF